METNPKTEPETSEPTAMHTRRIEIGEGRYLIFFTFGEEGETENAAEQDV